MKPISEINRKILEKQLKRHEGLRLEVYKDSVGVKTYGYGHNCTSESCIVGQTITLEKAEKVFECDLQNAIDSTEKSLPWIAGLDDVRRCVLYNMAFNLGVAGLLSFKRFLAALQRGDFEIASSEMKDSRWYRQVGKRSEELCMQMKTGKWMELRSML